MVQQNYIHRLALGRSAYEAPRTRPNNTDIQPVQNEAQPSQPHSDADADTAETPYIQRYDERGHPINPESRSAARRLRRAQNDVLSTIGITLPTETSASAAKSAESEAATRAELELEDFEAWSSLGLSEAAEAVLSVATAAVQSQRLRMQTFRRYAGVPIMACVRSEMRQMGVLQYCLAGKSQDWVTHVIDVALKLVAVFVPGLLGGLWVRCFGEESVGYKRRRRIMRHAEDVLFNCKRILLAPLYAVVSLQRLHLIPPTPLFIWPWHYSTKQAYLSLLPALPAIWTLGTTSQFLSGLPGSPLGLSLLMDCSASILREYLTRYMRAVLPRPDNPEKSAITGEDGSQDQWPMSAYPRLQPTFKEELARDLRWIGKTSAIYWYRLRNLFAASTVRRHRQHMLATFLEPSEVAHDVQAESLQLFREVQDFGQSMSGESAEQVEERLQRIEQSLHAINSTAPDNADYEHMRERLERANTLVQSLRQEMQSVPDQESERHHTAAPARHNSLQDEPIIDLSIIDSSSSAQDLTNQTTATPSGPATVPLTSQPSTAPSSPSLTAFSSSPASSPALEPTNVQVRTRSGSTSTLHMDVEINQAAVDGSTYTTSFSASPRSAAVETSVSQIVNDDGSIGLYRSAPHHRVSDLSLLPADFLANCLLDVGVAVLLLPLQSWQMRVLASRFAEATGRRDVAADVLVPGAVFGVGLRAGGVKGALGYMAKMAVCFGVETLLSLGGWMVMTRVAGLVGRRWLSWGKL